MIYRPLGFIAGLALLTSCATVQRPVTLSDKGSKLVALKEDTDSPSCLSLDHIGIKNESCNGNPTYLQNDAMNKGAEKGATHFYLNFSSKCSVGLNLYKCNAVFNLPLAELTKLCSSGNIDACLEGAYTLKRAGADTEQGQLEFYRVACKFKDQKSCDTYVTLRFKLERMEKIAKAITGCDQEKADQCLAAATIFYSDGDVKSALYYTQLACMHGNQQGCTNHKLMADDNNEASRQKLQLLMQERQIQFESEKAKYLRDAMISAAIISMPPRTVNVNVRYKAPYAP